jgi:hypothetical protein
MNLIVSTTTEKGLTIRCMLDENTYETGNTVTDELLKNVNLSPENFHGEWNYTIKKHP